MKLAGRRDGIWVACSRIQPTTLAHQHQIPECYNARPTFTSTIYFQVLTMCYITGTHKVTGAHTREEETDKRYILKQRQTHKEQGFGKKGRLGRSHSWMDPSHSSQNNAWKHPKSHELAAGPGYLHLLDSNPHGKPGLRSADIDFRSSTRSDHQGLEWQQWPDPVQELHGRTADTGRTDQKLME